MKIKAIKIKNFRSYKDEVIIAFNEITEEYHTELYGFIEAEGWLNTYKTGKPTINYNKILRDGSTRVEQIILTGYVRHQIHHPENTNNTKFTNEQLNESINSMRSFIETQKQLE